MVPFRSMGSSPSTLYGCSFLYSPTFITRLHGFSFILANFRVITVLCIAILQAGVQIVSKLLSSTNTRSTGKFYSLSYLNFYHNILFVHIGHYLKKQKQSDNISYQNTTRETLFKKIIHKMWWRNYSQTLF